jgi:hypothetical protein
VNILVVSNLYPPNSVGGYERLCALVANSLANRGHSVSVLTSDFGSARPEREEIQVERLLRLPVQADNIYRPFTGSASERSAIARHNATRLEEAIERKQPDAILVGNLYFFDSSILEPFRKVGERAVYLLTDIWMINFFESEFVQSYFRENVFELLPGTRPLIPAFPPGLLLRKVDLATPPGGDKDLAGQLSRHREIEESMAAGRDAFQVRGTCYLCGPTSFLIRREGPATIVLLERPRGEAICTTCGLDAAARAALHGLDLLATPEAPPSGILIAASSPHTRRALQGLFPQCTVVCALDEVADASTRRYRHAVCLQDETRDVPGRLRLLSTLVEPGGTIVIAEGCWSNPPVASAELVLELLRTGCVDPTAYAVWSTAYGYLGREILMHAAQAPARI